MTCLSDPPFLAGGHNTQQEGKGAQVAVRGDGFTAAVEPALSKKEKGEGGGLFGKLFKGPKEEMIKVEGPWRRTGDGTASMQEEEEKEGAQGEKRLRM